SAAGTGIGKVSVRLTHRRAPHQGRATGSEKARPERGGLYILTPLFMDRHSYLTCNLTPIEVYESENGYVTKTLQVAVGEDGREGKPPFAVDLVIDHWCGGGDCTVFGSMTPGAARSLATSLLVGAAEAECAQQLEALQ